MNSADTPEIAPEPPADGLVGRMFNVLAAPGETFDALRGQPVRHGHWLGPLILWILVGWIGGFLVLSRPELTDQVRRMSEQQIERQVAAGKMSPEQAERARTTMTRWMEVSQQIGVAVGVPLAAVASIFWWGLLLWLFGGKWLGGGFGYLKAVEVAGLASMVLVLESVLRTLLVMVTGNILAAPGPILLVMNEFDPGNFVHLLLSKVQVTTLWVLAVRAIGISRLGAGSAGRCFGWIGGFWAVWTGLWTAVGWMGSRLASQ